MYRWTFKATIHPAGLNPWPQLLATSSNIFNNAPLKESIKTLQEGASRYHSNNVRGNQKKISAYLQHLQVWFGKILYVF